MRAFAEFLGPVNTIRVCYSVPRPVWRVLSRCDRRYSVSIVFWRVNAARKSIYKCLLGFCSVFWALCCKSIGFDRSLSKCIGLDRPMLQESCYIVCIRVLKRFLSLCCKKGACKDPFSLCCKKVASTSRLPVPMLQEIHLLDHWRPCSAPFDLVLFVLGSVTRGRRGCDICDTCHTLWLISQKGKKYQMTPKLMGHQILPKKEISLFWLGLMVGIQVRWPKRKV